MEDENDTVSKDVVFGHHTCQTAEAKWLCLQDIYQKFHRPNFYDIGGTYVQDVEDFWFTYKTEQVNTTFLLHLFVRNHQEDCFTFGVSHNSDMKFDEKTKSVYLPTLLGDCSFQQVKNTQHYLHTYSFTEMDVELLINHKLYIAVSYSIKEREKQLFSNFFRNHDFSSLLDNPILSDFTMESSEGDKFKVHKHLLRAQSEVFRAMLKEDTAESQNSYVKLVNVGTEDLRCFLEFIYTGTLKDLHNSNYLVLLMLADQYNIVGLRDLCVHMLSEQFCTENACEILVVADMYNISELKQKAMQYIRKTPTVVQTSAFQDIKNAPLLREVCAFLLPLNRH